MNAFRLAVLIAAVAALSLRSDVGPAVAPAPRNHVSSWPLQAGAYDPFSAAWRSEGTPDEPSGPCSSAETPGDGILALVDELARRAAYLSTHGTARERLEKSLRDEIERVNLVPPLLFQPHSVRSRSELARAVCELIAGEMSDADFVRFSLRQPALAAAAAHLVQSIRAFESLAREHARSAIDRRAYDFAETRDGRLAVSYAPLAPGAGIFMRRHAFDGCITLRVVFADDEVLSAALRACSAARDELERVLAPLARAEHEALAEETRRRLEGHS